MSRTKMVAIGASSRHTRVTALNRLATLHGCIIKTNFFRGREMPKQIILFLVLSAAAATGQSQHKIAGAASFTTLASFDGSNGSGPQSPPVQGVDGNFYGTTVFDGAGAYCPYGGNQNSPACGTIYKVTPAGRVTVLYNFCSLPDCSDGAEPTGGLKLGTDGNFYGETSAGGNTSGSCDPFGCGEIFKITPSGKFTKLYSFCPQGEVDCPDGAGPAGTLLQAANGNFYGTTGSGGAECATFATGCGTVFEMTPSGKLTTLYRFCTKPGCPDGVSPNGGLVQAANGDLYGTTLLGGDNCAPDGCGTVLRITLSGNLTTLYSFCSQTNCLDGSEPNSGLVQASNGNFYGTTTQGGAITHCPSGVNCGTIFEMSSAGKLQSLYSFCSLENCSDGVGPTGGLLPASDGNLYGTNILGGAGVGVGGTVFEGTIFKIAPAGTLTTLYTFCTYGEPCPNGGDPNGLVQATTGNFYGTTAGGGDAGDDGTVFRLSVGLGPFVEALPTSGTVGTKVTILGNNLSGTTAVSFNGTAASFSIVSSTEITTTVPKGATTGTLKVTTSSGTLDSNGVFRVATDGRLRAGIEH